MMLSTQSFRMYGDFQLPPPEKGQKQLKIEPFHYDSGILKMVVFYNFHTQILLDANQFGCPELDKNIFKDSKHIFHSIKRRKMQFFFQKYVFWENEGILG